MSDFEIDQPTPVEVLVAHQRNGAASCLCGPLPLGSSFCQHQIDMLSAAGYEVVGVRKEKA